MTTIPAEITTWCAEIGAAFREYEHQLNGDLRRDRDAVLVEYALRVLANAHDPITVQILETIDRRRAVTA